jgi:uncharacterized protein (DUF1501 family)
MEHQRIVPEGSAMSKSREVRRREFHRRQWLKLAAAGLAVGAGSPRWIGALAADAARDPGRRRACILLWMTGGPSQIDTFDPKPGHPNGGPLKSIATAVPGIRTNEHLPKIAALMDHLALVRSMSTKEGDHSRATYYLRTGYVPQGQVHYPALGALVAKELADEEADLPGFVSIGPYRALAVGAYSPGFLGNSFAPLIVGEFGPGRPAVANGSAGYELALKVKDLDPAPDVDRARADARLDLIGALNDRFAADHPGGPAESHRTALGRAVRMMRSEGVKAFDLSGEPDRLRDDYGRNPFGQGCLLARRLVERGVPFVEVTLAGVAGAAGLGWDTHQQNFQTVPRLCSVLDAGWSTLLMDLNARGLLETTTVVWMGEFGRTPRINPQGGRDHFPNAWTTVLCGGGIKGGQVIGRTSDDGMRVDDRPVAVPDLIATVCHALGIDPTTQNVSNVGRPIRIADPAARPIREALA